VLELFVELVISVGFGGLDLVEFFIIMVCDGFLFE